MLKPWKPKSRSWIFTFCLYLPAVIVCFQPVSDVLAFYQAEGAWVIKIVMYRCFCKIKDVIHNYDLHRLEPEKRWRNLVDLWLYVIWQVTRHSTTNRCLCANWNSTPVINHIVLQISHGFRLHGTSFENGSVVHTHHCRLFLTNQYPKLIMCRSIGDEYVYEV